MNSKIRPLWVMAAIALLTATVNAESLKTTYNPFTGKLDYYTAVNGTNFVSGSGVTVSCTGGVCTFSASGSSASNLEMFTGPIRSSPTPSASFEPKDFTSVLHGTTFYTALNPATTDFIWNTASTQSGANFVVPNGTATNFRTGNIRFSSILGMMTTSGGTDFLAMPDDFTMYFGESSGITHSGDTFNTAFGSNSQAFPNSGAFNTSVGAFAMGANSITGQQNNAIGYASLNKVTSGSYNNAMGGSALLNLTSGSNNTAVGTLALNASNGNNNTAIGFQADYQNLAGIYNVMIGWNVGNGTTTLTDDDVLGSSNTWVGTAAGQGVPASVAINNSIALGYNAVVLASNTAQIGGIIGSGLDVNVHATSFTADASLFLGNVKSGNQCLHADSTGKVTGTGSDCGSGGGGGSSSLAVTTGTASTYANPAISSPTAVEVFDQALFKVTLPGATTAFITSISTITAASLGALTGNQNITVTGDVTGSGTTAITFTAASTQGNIKTFTSPITFQSSVTVQSSLGENVTYNLTAGTITTPALQVQTSSVTVLGASGLTVNSLTASLPVQTDANLKLISSAIDLSGSQATGVLAAGREPAHTGDVTNSAGSLAMTAAASQTHITQFTQPITMTSSLTVTSGGLSVVATDPATYIIGLGTSTIGNRLVSVSTAPAVLPSDYELAITSPSVSASPVMVFGIQADGHVVSSGTAPTVSSCGTSPSVDPNSTDFAMTINTGSASPTACTITFANAFTNTPVCVVTDDLQTSEPAITSRSATAITVTLGAALNSGHLFVICVGQKG